MKYYRVKNWEKFQHYKDRNPPWIKLHNSLMTDPDFLCLQDASKLHLIMIWLFASRSENKITTDEKLLTRLLMLDKQVDLSPLVSAGFLIPYDNCLQDASTTLADRLQLASPETEQSRAETETETEKYFCAIVENPTTTPNDSVSVLTFQTNGKSKTWNLTQQKINEWQEAFPEINILQECRRAQQWAIDKGVKKTAKGMPRFLFNWISRTNDRRQSNKPTNGTATHPQNRTLERYEGDSSQYDALFNQEPPNQAP